MFLSYEFIRLHERFNITAIYLLTVKVLIYQNIHTTLSLQSNILYAFPFNFKFFAIVRFVFLAWADKSLVVAYNVFLFQFWHFLACLVLFLSGYYDVLWWFLSMNDHFFVRFNIVTFQSKVKIWSNFWETVRKVYLIAFPGNVYCKKWIYWAFMNSPCSHC